MKKTGLFIVIILLVLLSSIFTGCAVGGMGINDRIREFVSDLNKTNRDSIKEHLHSDCSVSNSANEEYWDEKFDNDGVQNYSVGSITETGSKTRAVKILGGMYDADTFTFTMKEEDEDDWYILSISGPVSVP